MSNGSPPPPPPPGAPPSAPPPQPSYAPPPSSSPGPASSGSSGLPTWAKVGIGCGCLVLLIAAAGIMLLGWGAKKVVDLAQDPAKLAETMIELNPELEVIENDPDNGRMTVRNTKTGETNTFDYSEIESGNFTFEGKDGRVEIGGEQGVTVTDSEGNETFTARGDEDGGGLTITTEEGVTRIGAADSIPGWIPSYPGIDFSASGFSMTQGEKASGLLTAETDEPLDDLEKWYEKKLADDGFEVERSMFESGGNRTVIFGCKKAGVDNLQVTLSDSGEKRQIGVAYEGPAQ